MATAPQIALRDGSGFTTNLVFTTNQESIIITGTVTVDTAAVQISVNGGAFVSDPTLIAFDLQTITVPNPQSYPSGLLLEFGVNTIQLRSIDIVGGVSATSTVNVTRVRDASDVGTQIPTAVRVQRLRDSVNVLAAKPIIGGTTNFTPGHGEVLVVPASTSFIGFNFYASTSAGGTTGYYKINEKPIATTTVYEEDDITSNDDVIMWDNTNLKQIRMRISEEDDFGKELSVRYDKLYDASLFADKIRLNSTITSYRLSEFVTFNHVRSGGTGIINSDQFANVQDSDPLYYVVTGVYYDSTLNKEVETPFSQEVLGTPLTLDTAIRDLPGRTAPVITTDYISAIMRVNQDIALIPGSTTRDVSIDPFASEAERLWFLLDFVHRSSSFLTLLQIDDVNGDGVSDDVVSSAYKMALKAAIGLQTDDGVQNLIDQQFEKLAGNANKTRLPGRPSVGQVIIYTTTRPTKDIVIPADTYVTATADPNLNLPSVRFRIAGSYTLPAADADAFYNFDAKRYQLVVDVVCETTGSIGNRAAGTITTITGVNGVFVTNEAATVFGNDRESNADLAARSMLAFVSVDTGTEGGYASTSASQLGIVKAKIVKSDDPLMMRDYDPVRHKHVGGKVDIWVQGLRERQVSDTFAFTFEVARNVQCQVIDLANLVFRVLDSRVTPQTPIIEILNNPAQGLGVNNVTTGENYDLTGVTVIDYQTFQINTAIAQPATHIDDVIEADYRFRVVNQFFFTQQPARRVVSVVGEVAGALTVGQNYSLYKTDDPLITGESTIARDYLTLTQFGGKPSGSTITVNNELHVMIGFFQEPLGAVGINTKTIRVFSSDRLTEYGGPDAAVPDFDITPGTPTTPAKIVRTSASQIVSGQQVSVDYVHDENFTVTYVVNELLQELQQVINRQRHTTADVLVKQAIQNAIDIETTIQLAKGATKDKVDPLVRSNVSLELNQKTIGEGIAQSNVNAAINNTTGVAFNVLPMAKMAYADGSIKLRETLNSNFLHVASLDSGGNVAYLLTSALENPTTDGGGLTTEHRGVFQDDEPMALASSMTQVATLANQAWVIGNTGAIINGYSDDATLQTAGFLTAASIQAERLRRTANHVIVSLSGAGVPPDDPSKHAYAVSYIIRGDFGSHDIVASDVEFIDEGEFTITYRQAT